MSLKTGVYFLPLVLALGGCFGKAEPQPIVIGHVSTLSGAGNRPGEHEVAPATKAEPQPIVIGHVSTLSGAGNRPGEHEVAPATLAPRG